jgi:hypothetical protein
MTCESFVVIKRSDGNVSVPVILHALIVPEVDCAGLRQSLSERYSGIRIGELLPR